MIHVDDVENDLRTPNLDYQRLCRRVRQLHSLVHTVAEDEGSIVALSVEIGNFIGGVEKLAESMNIPIERSRVEFK